jgi:hypothetical protein
MNDEMMHAQMAALYAQQRNQIKPLASHLEDFLPPDLCASVEHYAQARNCTARQALSNIVSKFFGPCFQSQPSATSQLTPKSAK